MSRLGRRNRARGQVVVSPTKVDSRKYEYLVSSTSTVERARTIRIEGECVWGRGGGGERVWAAPYSAGPRCWITQNTYQFYIGFLGGIADRIREFLAGDDVYTACSLVRKWINVINGHRGKSSPGNWFSCRGPLPALSHCSLLPRGQDGRMRLGLRVRA